MAWAGLFVSPCKKGVGPTLAQPTDASCILLPYAYYPDEMERKQAPGLHHRKAVGIHNGMCSWAIVTVGQLPSTVTNT